MKPEAINNFLASWEQNRERTIVIVDFANVCKWNVSLGWSVGIPQLGNLVKHLSKGNKQLRRFYYGADFGR